MFQQLRIAAFEPAKSAVPAPPPIYKSPRFGGVYEFVGEDYKVFDAMQKYASSEPYQAGLNPFKVAYKLWTSKERRQERREAFFNWTASWIRRKVLAEYGEEVFENRLLSAMGPEMGTEADEMRQDALHVKNGHFATFDVPPSNIQPLPSGYLLTDTYRFDGKATMEYHPKNHASRYNRLVDLYSEWNTLYHNPSLFFNDTKTAEEKDAIRRHRLTEFLEELFDGGAHIVRLKGDTRPDLPAVVTARGLANTTSAQVKQLL